MPTWLTLKSGTVGQRKGQVSQKHSVLDSDSEMKKGEAEDGGVGMGEGNKINAATFRYRLAMAIKINEKTSLAKWKWYC